METINEARNFIVENIKEGCICPVCDRFLKIYKRNITRSMAHSLCLIYKYFKDNQHIEWLHVEDYLKTLDIPSSTHGDYQKLAYWGLLENKIEKREDGSDRNGYWKITEKGKLFAENKIKLSKYCDVDRGNPINFYGESISIKEIKSDFNYDELMHDYYDEKYEPQYYIQQNEQLILELH